MSDYQSTGARNRSITAFFDTRDAADKARRDLVAAGLPEGDVTITGSQGSSGTAAGQARGLWDELKDLFLPDEDRSAYAEGLRRGGYVLSLRSDEASYNRVLGILDQDGAVDLDEREQSWRQEGWTGSVAPAATGSSAAAALGASAGTARADVTIPTTAAADRTQASRTAVAEQSTGLAARTGTVAASSQTTGTTADLAGRDEVIPVYEEQLRVGKRDINHGRVRVRSYVVETPVTEQVSLRSESIQVERRPVDRPVTGADVAFQDRVIELEEHAEEAVIAKEARIKEEIALRKTVEQHAQTVSDTVRHTEVEVQDERGRALGSPAVGFSAATDANRITEHMDVISADGVKIGTVDHLDGPDKIKLAKNTSPDGQHHFVPLTWVDHVDTHVHLKKTSAEAKAGW